jgi:hypothetical protein
MRRPDRDDPPMLVLIGLLAAFTVLGVGIAALVVACHSRRVAAWAARILDLVEETGSGGDYD